MESQNTREFQMEIPKDRDFWIFGYGSLIWKTTFPYVKKSNGYIKGWKRVWFQGSTDHRGVPGNPGRVVTLDQCEVHDTTICNQAKEHREEVLAYLDFREKGGYSQSFVKVYCVDKSNSEELLVSAALIYVAEPDNTNYLGPSSFSEIARQIAISVGPSGPNYEYLFNLSTALREIQQDMQDDTFILETLVKQLLATPINNNTQ